jgi:hypothetical protein
MSYRTLMSGLLLGIVGALLLTASIGAAGQAPPSRATATAAKAPAVPRAPDGHPDLQGVWDFRTITPLQRPDELAAKDVLNDQELAEFEVKNRRNQDNREKTPGRVVNGQQSNADVERAYNDFWWDFGTKAVKTKRTSLIIDPPDGRIPALTPEAQKRGAARREAAERPAWGPEDRSVGERCILGFNAGPPFAPGAYNNNVQLVQTRDYVVIHNEMVHNARVVPIAARQAAAVPTWNGNSRGRWDGNTLVVETKGFRGQTAFQNSSENLQLTERFTRVDADTLIYEFTVNDPATWTKPWTAQIPMTRSADLMYEYACHEANYGMTNLLKGARFLEQEDSTKQKTSSRP